MASTTTQRWTVALLALASMSLLLLLHPYRGIVHDGHLYTLQALSKLQPELYGNDVFLRYGSQDDYTLFPSLYARTIAWFGLEPAAAAVTLVSILLFLTASLMLARTLMPAPQAWLALVLLLLVPAHYGPGQIFHFIEEFVTPRQLAEALTLFSIFAWLKRWRTIGAATAAGAMLLHPIIGLSGLALLVVFELVLPHLRKLWPLAALAAILATTAILGWIDLERWQFDTQWRGIAMSRLYLSLENWDTEDWGRVVTVFASLAVSALSLEDRARRIALATLIASGGLLLAALVGGDVLDIVIVIQAQLWRGLWLATVLALLLLPTTWTTCWNQKGLHRCSVLLLSAAWAAPDASIALILAPLALLAEIAAPRQAAARYTRLLLPGAWLALILISVYAVADGLLSFHGGLTRMPGLPPTLDRIVTFSLGGVPPALVLLATYGLMRLKPRSAPVPLAACAVAVAAVLTATSGKTWAHTQYPEQLLDKFAGWRALIPVGSDVYWAGQSSDREDSAFYTWLLLERPSFISRNQASNALFSRRAALEMHDRARMLDGLLPFWDPFQDETPEIRRPLKLTPVCRNTPVRFVVSKEALADAEGISPLPGAGSELGQYKLYICP